MFELVLLTTLFGLMLAGFGLPMMAGVAIALFTNRSVGVGVLISVVLMCLYVGLAATLGVHIVNGWYGVFTS